MASTAGILSKLCRLGYSSTSSGTPTFLDNLQEVPDLGSAPETVDVTCLGDGNKRSIPGLVDFGSLEFTFLYDATIFNTLKSLSGSQYWTLEFNDAATSSGNGSKFVWQGKPTVYTTGFGVNAALQFKLVIGVESDVTFTPAN